VRLIANALPLAQQPATETLAPFTSIYLQCANASSLYRSGCATIVTIKLRGETCMRGTLSGQLSFFDGALAARGPGGSDVSPVRRTKTTSAQP